MSCDPGPKPAVRLTGVKKAYRLYDRGHHRLLQAIAGARRRYYRSHTALDGIDLTIGVGETVGVIGANGAGKSTLLGVVTGTITPDEGQVAVSGRVAPMLELGAGFHPDFTGAENIRLAARVLGLAQAEIDARFDAIVEFSGIAAHMDQPVKH